LTTFKREVDSLNEENIKLVVNLYKLFNFFLNKVLVFLNFCFKIKLENEQLKKDLEQQENFRQETIQK